MEPGRAVTLGVDPSNNFVSSQSTKAPLLSVILTSILLFLVGICGGFFLLVALNGVPESQGTVAILIWLIGYLLVMVLAGIAAAWVCRGLVTKFQWPKVGAVLTSVFLSTSFGAVSCFLCIILSSLFAGVR